MPMAIVNSIIEIDHKIKSLEDRLADLTKERNELMTTAFVNISLADALRNPTPDNILLYILSSHDIKFLHECIETYSGIDIDMYNILLGLYERYTGIDWELQEELKPFKEQHEKIGLEWQGKINEDKKYVYLCYQINSGLYKIGFSKHPIKRMYQIMLKTRTVINLVHVIPTETPRKFERHLHTTYESYKVGGEWFDFPENIVNVIKSVGSAYNLIESETN